MAALEAEALRQARAAFETRARTTSRFVAGNLSRARRPPFRPGVFRVMRAKVDEFDALLIFDEVQTGCGLTEPPGHTSSWRRTRHRRSARRRRYAGGWFVGGVRALHCVFGPITAQPTWGGNLNTWCAPAASGGHRSRGPVWSGRCSTAFARPRRTRRGLPGSGSRSSGRGLMCAFSLPTAADRDELIRQLGNVR